MSPQYLFTPPFLVGSGGQGVMVMKRSTCNAHHPSTGAGCAGYVSRESKGGDAPSGREFEGWPLYTLLLPRFLVGRGGQGVMVIEAECLQSASLFDRLRMCGLRQQRVQSGRCMSEPLQWGVQRGAAPSGREFEGCPLNTSLLPPLPGRKRGSGGDGRGTIRKI